MADTCVILLNMGAPRDEADIEPYLKALFSDPHLIRLPLRGLLAPLVIRLRAPKVRKKYALIGGSPLIEITQRQALALEAALNWDRTARYRVLIGMRYGAPSLEKALDLAVKMGSERIVALSMYPQYCSATTGSSLAELQRRIQRLGPVPEPEVIDRYPDEPGYVSALGQTVREAMEEIGGSPHVLFSAHGIPEQLVREGDPYVEQTRTTARAVAQEIGLSQDRWQLSFQSRVGPVRWVGPHSDKVIDELGAKGIEGLVLVPISFTADNLETVYDMDVVLAERARRAGIEKTKRARTLNNDAGFIAALASLVQTK